MKSNFITFMNVIGFQKTTTRHHVWLYNCTFHIQPPVKKPKQQATDILMTDVLKKVLQTQLAKHKTI